MSRAVARGVPVSEVGFAAKSRGGVRRTWRGGEADVNVGRVAGRGVGGGGAGR